ncbi:hypothetical protein Tco_0120960 [Tanacetum coccineum]
MSTQHDIYVASSENRPPMLNKDNYVPRSSRLIRYAKSKPNVKLLVNSIKNGPYMMNSHRKKSSKWKLMIRQFRSFSWSSRRFTSTEGESTESYYHRLSKLMNDFSRNKHFPEKIASNLKFLNNLQPEWQSVTNVHQTKDLHEVDYIHLYDFLKFNQAEVDVIRAERLARTHDPLALMANSQNPHNNLVFYPDQPYPLTYMQQPQPNNNYIPQPSFNTNYMQQPMPNPKDISDPQLQ